MTKLQWVIFFVTLFLAIFLRVYQLDQNPPSLFSDEVDLGYQAYSFLTTGRDYNGNFFPVHFQSFADLRTPLYIYSVVPFVALLGLNEWAIRLPAAVFGALGVLGIFVLIRQLGFSNWKALTGMMLMALSPWHLQYSRAGFEVTLMLSLIIFGVSFFLKGLKSFPLLLLSLVLLGLAIYSYSTAKLFVPLISLLLVSLNWTYFIKMSASKKIVLLVTVILVVLPMLLDTLSGKSLYRFSYTSIMADPTTPKEVNIARLLDSGQHLLGQQANLLSFFFHNKFLSIFNFFINNFLSAFSTNFLFLQGDPIGRHSVGKMGEFYLVEVAGMILGLIYFIKTADRKTKWLIFGWILFAPIPASLTVGGGNHATRLILLLVPLAILSSFGFSELFKEAAKNSYAKRCLSILVLLFLIFNIATYLHQYYVHYPKEQERIWHYGFKQAILESEQLNKYQKVVITNNVEPPLIFALFWTKYDPVSFQNNKLEKAQLNGFGDEVGNIGRYYLSSFRDDIVLQKRWSDYLTDDMLVIASRKDIPVDLTRESIDGVKLVDVINYPSGEPAFYLITKQ